MQPFVVESPAAKYGGGFIRDKRPEDPGGAALAAVAGPAPEDVHPILSPRSPMLWFGVLAAATFGLMHYSTSVAVGPVSAAVKVG
jgi:hypothetical protein